MNRINKVSLLSYIFFALTLTASLGSCSKDSNDDDGGNNLDNVPSGELVAVELRNETLTGFPEGGNQSGTQKWWTHVITSVKYSNSQCGEDLTYTDLGYMAFYPSGEYYLKTSLGEQPEVIGSWEWANSTKSAILVTNSLGQQAEFSVTWLNDNNVVYGSNQGGTSCSVTTYEQFNDPFFE